MLHVDIDEADVAVLSQNLTRLRELFADVNKLLLQISSKTRAASRSIKPVLAEFNTLTAKKYSVEEGLNLLKGVSQYASRAADLQKTLSAPVEKTSVPKYVDSLRQSTQLVGEMRRDIRDFDTVVIGFANVVDKAEMALVAHLTKLIQGEIGAVRQGDAAAILAYFAQKGQLRMVNDTLQRAFSRHLADKLASAETKAAMRQKANVPYEKGSLGLSAYVEDFVGHVEALLGVCRDLQVDDSVLQKTVSLYSAERLMPVVGGYTKFFEQHGLASNDIAALDVLENLRVLDVRLQATGASIQGAKSEYLRLLAQLRGLLKEWVRYVEQRVFSVERLNEISVPEVVVEVVSRIRRIAEFESLLLLLDGARPGLWLDTLPPPQFVSVFTSVVPGAETGLTALLVLLYLSDLMDALMVDLEIRIKEQEPQGRKLAQGYTLLKNLVMVETIVNRLEGLYERMGAAGMERLQRLKDRFLKLFLEDWNRASYIIVLDMTQITATHALHNNVLSNKEREQIKELFRSFNELFEEALRQYEKFNIQEKALRQYLGNEIKKLIVHAYNKLYDRFGQGEWTKNRTKYVKWDKVQFERLLNERL